MKSILLLLFSTYCFSQAQLKAPLTSETIHICAEDAGWLPYSIPILNKDTSYDFKGLNLDLITHIFKKYNLNFKIEVKPWQRCLKEGKEGKVNIVLDAASTPQRLRDYLLTRPVYLMTPAFFYHRDDKKKAIKSELFLENSSFLCGQSGYTYQNFNVDDHNVHKLSKSIQRVFELVNIKRCQIGLSRLEVLKVELNSYAHAKNISYHPIPKVDKEPFYWLINKNFKYSKALKNLINKEINELINTKKMQKFYKKYNL